jgi:ssDNA-binding Zn-finger/Zn-ribbon topoisomerase 1
MTTEKQKAAPKLKPCPFCGGKAQYHENLFGSKWVECSNKLSCRLHYPWWQGSGLSKERVVWLWNGGLTKGGSRK